MIALAKIQFSKFLLKARLPLGFIIYMHFISCSRIESIIVISGETWGTTYSIRIVDEPDVKIDIESIQFRIDSIFLNIDKQMSTYKLDSEISLFNQMSLNESINISKGFSEVIDRSIYWSELTSKAFDISVLPLVLLWRKGIDRNRYNNTWEPPTDKDIINEMSKIGFNKINLEGQTLIKMIEGQMLDVNAIAKGWGVDQVFEFLITKGLSRFMVEIGGEVRVLGANNKGSEWKIGIDRPIENNQPGKDIIAVVSLKNKAMATSGNYRNFFQFNEKKYSHIIDPRNGKSTQSNISSVSVMGPNCMDADVLSTALSVLSLEEGKTLIASLDGFEAYWIIKDLEGNSKIESSNNMPVVSEL